MAKFTQDVVSIGQDDFVSSPNSACKLGARAVSDDGRVFRYVQAGALALVPGNVVQAAAAISAHLGNTPPVVPVGATSFVYTPGAAAAPAGAYADGYMQVDTPPGGGFTYGVSGHGAIGSGAPFTLNLKDPIQVALTAVSRVGLAANPYKGVIQSPVTTATGMVVGVATYVINANEFGWVQTWGMASVLIAGTPALGAMVMAPGAVAGAAEVVTTTNLVVAQAVGQMAQVGVAGKNGFVYLRINP